MAPMGLLQRIWRRGLHITVINFIIFGLLNFLPTLADRQAYRTAYGCEGARLSITCDPGHVINVIRANYGRFSITICNNHGNTEWSVNCQSPRTHRVLADRCSGEASCEVNVSSENFGDPCPGTFKYIEVHYTCGLATTSTTTARPRPPWFIGTREPVWLPPSINSSLVTVVPSHENFSSTSVKSTSSSAPITTSTTTTVATTSTTKTSAASTATTPSMTTVRLSSMPPDYVVVDREEENLNRTNSGEFSSTSHRPSITPHIPLKALPATPPSFGSGTTYDTPWCAPSFARGLYWNWTKAGEKAELACPGGATGMARRKCLIGEWDGPADLSDCRSAWLTALKKRARPNTQDSVLAVATDLAKVTASKALYGGDLITASQLIKTLSRRMMQDVTTAFPEPHQRQALITEFLLAALETGSALLSAGMVGPWGDLSSKERRFAVTELMVGLEEATFLLGDVLPEGTQSALYKSHVLASARAVSPDGTSVKFPSAEDESLDWVFTDTVVLPPEVMFENTEGSVTRIVFLAYRHLEDLLSPPHDNTLGRQGRKNVSRIVNSRVVSASLGHGRHIQLSELSKPVTLTLSLLRHDNVSNPICAFWDYSTHDWSDEGCYTHSFNRTHVTCKCDHLTNFAVIMEESSGVDVQETISPIRILAFVGCLICVVCVAGSILMFTLFKGISSPRTFIQRHVCVCLLVAELVFLIGVWRTDLPVLCGVVAGVLHYFILAAFAWMFIEGVHVYLSMTKPVDSDCSYLHWWHYVLAYGAPLLVVCGAAVVDPFSFGTPDFCWLRTDNYFIFSLVGPALILVAIQVVLLGMTLLRTCMFNPDETLKTKEMARLASSRSWLRSAMVILLLMVLNWTLGLLLLHQPSIALAAAFCTFNSLHGVFIFVYYCIRNQKVREWCGSSEQGGRSTWIPRMFRNVFATDKQTYSPNNNNNMTANSSLPPDSSSSSTSSPHHQAISQALNQALSAGPNVQQYLPTLAHVGTMKGHANHPQSPPPFLEGTSMLGSRGSLRQMGSVGCPLPMGSLHQSLQRRHHHPHHLDSINTSTITTPVITTATHLGPTTSLSAPMIDEDVSYKSFSRDSGHGGSEQEDSPRTQWTGQHHRFCNSDMRTSYVTKMNTLNQTKVDPNIACSYSVSPSPNTVTPSIAAILRAGGGQRANSPWNHTYMEIESDPVYEEIERERWARAGVGGSEVMQVSDLSDEDLKRGTPSDVSRQSSRSYGDSHPLLPYLQHPMRQSKESQFALSEERLRDFNAAQMSRDLEHLQQVQQHLSRENLMTVAVLNGEQVVCRLSSPSHPAGPQNLSIIHEGNRAHSTAPSPTSNGYPSHFVVSRPHMIHCNDFNEC